MVHFPTQKPLSQAKISPQKSENTQFTSKELNSTRDIRYASDMIYPNSIAQYMGRAIRAIGSTASHSDLPKAILATFLSFPEFVNSQTFDPTENGVSPEENPHKKFWTILPFVMVGGITAFAYCTYQLCARFNPIDLTSVEPPEDLPKEENDAYTNYSQKDVGVTTAPPPLSRLVLEKEIHMPFMLIIL